ncbi:MAG: hypothetical protein SVY41_01295, partial [Candidatus Nanohaloarchaea archaeon]|nr:hypothetical protein [Candidatus Nanohaloarchaea archaeon]
MADVNDVLKRLKREFVKVNLLQASLDALIVFLSLNLVLFLFSVEILPGVSTTLILAGVGVAVFLVDLAYRAHQYRLEIYEERNPELREILRTARDYRDRDTFVTRAMVQDLMTRIRQVTSDSIIPTRALIQKILVVGALSFLTLASGLTSFQLQEHGGALLPSIDRGGENEDRPVLQNTTEIYGEASDIGASDLDLGFNITGEGEREQGGGEHPRFRSGEDAALEAAEQRLSEDLVLAKQYSV